MRIRTILGLEARDKEAIVVDETMHFSRNFALKNKK